MGAILEILKNLGTVRLAIMGAVVIGLIIFFVFLTTRFTGSNMELLYSNLDSTDSGQIVTQLDAQKIPYRLEGNSILVPADQVARVRVSLAGQGIPGGGSVGYEIFDETSAIGTTNFVQDVNLVRALEGELARTIRSINVVNSARVHIVLPRRQLFSREEQEASASVVLKLQSAGRLGKEQVRAIQHLIAAAVPKLSPDKVSVIDSRGNLLARGTGDDNEQAVNAELEEKRLAFQNQLEQKITDLLEKSVGIGKVKAEVTAELDFDKISTTEETFDPEGQVVRSTQTLDEQSLSDETEGTQPVTVATNLPDGTGAGTGSPKSTSRETRTEETVNYEISKRVVNHQRESGIVNRLSVAVLVDGNMVEGEDGDPVYRERDEREMENLAKLVATAVGYNQERGDTVEVINMRFAEIQEDFEEPLQLFFGLQKNDLLRIAEVVVLSILGILVILLVVRPLVSRAFEALPAAAAAAEQRLLEEQAAAAAAAAAIAPPEGEPREGEEFEELIDIDRVEGRVRASSVKKVGEIVEKHPDEALSIIRTWMYQEG